MESMDSLMKKLQDLQLQEEEEESLNEKLQNLRTQLEKKQSFEDSVSCIKSLLIQNYSSASPLFRNSIYTVVCRVGMILQTRYTAPRFWISGKELFEEAERFVTESSERGHLKTFIAKACEHLHDVEKQHNVSSRHKKLKPSEEESTAERDSSYLFEGHLTVDPEPPKPVWLVEQEFLHEMAAQYKNHEISAQYKNHEIVAQYVQARRERYKRRLIKELGNKPEPPRPAWQSQSFCNSDVVEVKCCQAGRVNNRRRGVAREELGINMGLFHDLFDANETSLQGIRIKRPPASKDVVMKLPLVTVTEEILMRLGSETECSICKEDMFINDKMQELPCKHLLHPSCLKPWLDKDNSCPVCWYELPTDHHAYEGQKERDKEAKEERKGAANALPGGEYMYL